MAASLSILTNNLISYTLYLMILCQAQEKFQKTIRQILLPIVSNCGQSRKSIITLLRLWKEALSLTNYGLSQNYPNLFNPSTKISYTIPTRNYVLLKVFDLLGCEIVELVNEEMSAGKYELNWNAANLPSGVYFYMSASWWFCSNESKMVLKK